MNLTNFILWLTVGAVIGWFASRLVKAERKLIYAPQQAKKN
ncbi:MAG: hypothetical protein ACYDH1_04595 [Anaerolineaceae bacterium]|jgi:uncharacterized membrane protein YeaQ/YmgE (transglycosylase-associated protein family)